MTTDGTLKGDLAQAYERGGWNAVADLVSTLTSPAVHPLLRCDCDEPCGMAGCEPGEGQPSRAPSSCTEPMTEAATRTRALLDDQTWGLV